MTSPLPVASADFAFNLLRAAAEPGTNAFFSPASISLALAMTYAGAEGETAQQIRDALFNGVREEHIRVGMSHVVRLLTEPKSGFQLHSANRIYGQDGLKLQKDFVAILTKHYKSTLQSVDFKSNSESVRQAINQWVQEVTKNRIKDLLAPGMLDADTRLLLVNALYFKADWEQKFDGKNTEEATFYSAKDKETTVQMMRKCADFIYGETRQVQVLGMRYKASDLTMFVFLPKERYGLEKFEQELTGQNFMKLVQNTWRRRVLVYMPKLKLEQSFNLKEALEKLGMKDMFIDCLADFSKITAGKNLYVSAVIHKAFVEVNEEGSEAAAATAVRFCPWDGAVVNPLPTKFIADHNFLFAILDNNTNDLLFTGRFSNV